MALHLAPGMFVVQLSEGPWRYPFILTIPHVTFPSAGNIDGGGNSMGALAHLPTLASPTTLEGPQVISLEEISSPDVEEQSSPLSDAERRYLEAVLAHPSLPSSRYASIARVGQNRAKRIRETLIDKGYLREWQVNATGRGRSALLLEPLEPALLLRGWKANTSNGEGS